MSGYSSAQEDRRDCPERYEVDRLISQFIELFDARDALYRAFDAKGINPDEVASWVANWIERGPLAEDYEFLRVVMAPGPLRLARGLNSWAR